MDELKKTFVEWCRQYSKEPSTFWQWKHSISPVFIDDTKHRTYKHPLPSELEPFPEWKLKELKDILDRWHERQQRLLRNSLVLKP